MRRNEATVETIVARLAEAGRRRTAPRQAIVESIVRAGGHVTADEVAAEVQSQFPSVNISTVYRTLDTLEDIGVIDHVHLGHGRAVYHLVEEDHQHLVCEVCESVEELPASKLPVLDPDDREGLRVRGGPPALRDRRCVPSLPCALLAEERRQPRVVADDERDAEHKARDRCDHRDRRIHLEPALGAAR